MRREGQRQRERGGRDGGSELGSGHWLKPREWIQTAECSTARQGGIPAGSDPNKILEVIIKKIFCTA
jgi:hypothetical protein